ETQHVVDGVVVETADAGAARTGSFGLEIEHVSDHAGFPEQMTVERRAELIEAGAEFGEHAEAEEPVRGDILIAADSGREPPAVAASQTHQRYRIGCRLPQKVASTSCPQRSGGVLMPRQEIQTRLAAILAVH